MDVILLAILTCWVPWLFLVTFFIYFLLHFRSRGDEVDRNFAKALFFSFPISFVLALATLTMVFWGFKFAP